MTADYLLGIEAQEHEINVEQLPVQGELPTWLRGTLIRNGPGKWSIETDNYRHWFDGLAMLHAFTIHDEGVSYANRFLQSPAYKANEEARQITYSEFATDPCRGLFKRVMQLFHGPEFGGNASVNLTKLADEYIAMTEVPLAIRFDPETLETLGVKPYDIDGQMTTAHPHFNHIRKVGLNYAVELNVTNKYNFYCIEGTQMKLLGSVRVDKPGYIHSFGMTENYLVLVEYPFKLLKPLNLATGVAPFIENYKWLPEQPTRFLLISLDSGELVKEFYADSFFSFHHINAFERDGEVIVDLCAYDDPSVIDMLFLDKLYTDGPPTQLSRFRRYRLDVATGETQWQIIGEESIDLPRIHYSKHNGRPYHFVYGIGTNSQFGNDFTNQLVKINVETGVTLTWFQEGHYPGEPVFVPAPEGQAEDEGVVLSVVLDATAGYSYLLVLNAQDFTEMARVEVSQHIPFGFHGQFFN